MRNRVIIGSTLGALAFLGASFWWWNANPERRFQFLENKASSCANCRKHLSMSLRVYASEHDGWLPKGKATPLESLSLLAQGDPNFVYSLTSHDQQPELVRQWQDQKRLPEKLMCYRYNEGLREDDSPQLIVLYYDKPTLWECSQHKKQQIGRPVETLDGSWTFMPEEEFARKQALTEEFLRARRDKVTGEPLR